MSGPFALGAVTAVLRNLLLDGMAELAEIAATVGTVSVTSVPPDTIRLDDPDAARLNLFLHRVTHDVARGSRIPPAPVLGGRPPGGPPLALDLHYLLTAHDPRDFHAEILLGGAMSVLQARPVLDRSTVVQALDPTRPDSTIPSSELEAFAASGLADQADPIRITIEPLGGEELSRLWSALRTPLRPSAAYLVSGVLIS